jgi:hypothetical protein
LSSKGERTPGKASSDDPLRVFRAHSTLASANDEQVREAPSGPSGLEPNRRFGDGHGPDSIPERLVTPSRDLGRSPARLPPLAAAG